MRDNTEETGPVLAYMCRKTDVLYNKKQGMKKTLCR